MIVPLQPGETLGKFEILKLVARDGQAHVYIARIAADAHTPLATIQRRLNAGGVSSAFVIAERICVLKLAAPEWVDSLRDEHSYLLRSDVQHPRLITLFSDPRGETSTANRKEPKGLWFADLRNSNGESLRLPYIAINYLPGGTLKHLLDQRGRRPLPAATTVQIALQVAEALDHLHTKAGIIHHDISPSNIIFRNPLNALHPQTPDSVLIDLAVADMPGKPRRTQIYGKKTYLPPERLLNKPGSHGPLVDVYGLGVVIYECLVGKLPNTGTDKINIPLPLPPIREQATRISEQLAALVMAAVDHDPRQRPTLPQLVSALEHTPEFHVDSRLRGKLTRPIVTALISIALVGVFLVGGLVLTFTQASQPSLPAQPNITTSGPQLSPTALPSPTPTLRPTSTPSA
jgi:serine/threonine protein kinase